MDFDTVLFDLGGTLIKYENEYSWRELAMLGCRHAAPFVKESTGIEVSPDLLAGKLLKTIDDLMKAQGEDLAEIRIYDMVTSVLSDLGVNVSDGLPAKFVEIYYQPTTEQIVLEKGAVEILSSLRGKGKKIGLVSNSIFPAEFHRSEMKRFGIFDFFDFTIFSSEAGIRKPNKEIYLGALKLAGASPERTVFVGDRMLEDVAGPKSIGMKAILKYDDRRDYSLAEKPFKTIFGLVELEEIFFG